MALGPAPASLSDGPPAPQLRRVLRLRDLIVYGIVIIQPIAPVPIFGITQDLARGHAVTAVLIAGIAMMLTAFSYGRMAALFPMAGSAYSYVGRGLNPHLGFLAGWAMALDYLILPIVAVIQAALTLQRLIPAAHYAVLVTLCVVGLTGINLRGIRSTARANTVLLIGMSAVIGAFLIAAIAHLLTQRGAGGLFSTRPFYDSATFNGSAIATATSFAALTYIGFDGVTTLAEDVENPRRNVLIAIVSVCAFTTLFSCLLVYLAQLVWPDYRSFPNAETAFMDVTRRVGGNPLFQAMGIVIMLGSLGSGLTGKVAAARLLYAMGRDEVLPRRPFGYLDPVRNNPTYNILLIGVCTLAGALCLDLEHAGELLNFGAFLSFIGVNLAALRQSYLHRQSVRRAQIIRDVGISALGLLFSLGMWLSLPVLAKVVGGAWFAAGIAYSGWRSRGFRHAPGQIDFSGH
jgi:putrescine importer